MSDATIFYILGSALAASAVLVSFAGLHLKGFPGKLGPLIVLWFIALIGGAATFAVLNGQDEQEARAEETATAGKEFVEEEQSPESSPSSSETGNKGGGKPKVAPAKGPGGTLQLAADQTQIAFDKTKLTSKPGKVTIDFDNPSALEHDVAIEQNGKEIAVSETITSGKTSVSASLAPGTYTFLCTIPGHAEAGMEGTLIIK